MTRFGSFARGFRVGSVVLMLAAALPSLAGNAFAAPDVTLVPRAQDLSYLMYPEFYATLEDARADTAWSPEHQAEVVRFWNENGERLLDLVSDLAGIKWYEKAFQIFLVEEAPNWGTADPLIFPVENWRRGDVVRVGPREHAVAFVMAHLLAQRLFEQVPENKRPDALDHPLFRPGMATRDNMANLVAYWTVAELSGEEVAMSLASGKALTNESPGLEFMVSHFLPRWRLTEKKPLVKWVEEEPVDSDLVKEAVNWRTDTGYPPVEGRRTGVERSRIGMRVRPNEYGDVVVTAVEPGKMAALAGLRPHDVLVRVSGITVQNERDVLARLIAIIRIQEEASVMVDRDGALTELTLRMSDIHPEQEGTN